ncbi:MAG: polyhydroxyalkanoate depolymerase, partial [Pseudooceanicola sp.]|nr:polyhydroxyalkanoate depolymerase [Pseudooceanicola sp.]
MLYQLYQAQDDLLAPIRNMAARTRFTGYPFMQAFDALTRPVDALMEMIARYQLTHTRPAWGIEEVTSGNQVVRVREEIALDLPFGTLLHFAKDIDAPQPKVLIVAPMSGHFATLLAGTVRTMLADHDVYITDW